MRSKPLAELLHPLNEGRVALEVLLPARGRVWVGYVGLDASIPEALVARLSTWLPESERERLQRFRFPQDRHAFLLGRALMRGLLGRLQGTPPEKVGLVLGPHGRPEAAPSGLGDALSFNLSHTRGLLGFAVARQTLGLDVESFRRDPDPLAIGAQVFSAEELAALRALDPPARRDRFRRLWTLKEAYLKARGTGLSLSAREITCRLGARNDVELSFTEVVEDRVGRWTCKELQPTEKTYGAICVETIAGLPVEVEEAWIALPQA